MNERARSWWRLLKVYDLPAKVKTSIPRSTRGPAAVTNARRPTASGLFPRSCFRAAISAPVAYPAQGRDIDAACGQAQNCGGKEKGRGAAGSRGGSGGGGRRKFGLTISRDKTCHIGRGSVSGPCTASRTGFRFSSLAVVLIPLKACAVEKKPTALS